MERGGERTGNRMKQREKSPEKNWEGVCGARAGTVRARQK